MYDESDELCGLKMVAEQPGLVQPQLSAADVAGDDSIDDRDERALENSVNYCNVVLEEHQRLTKKRGSLDGWSLAGLERPKQDFR